MYTELPLDQLAGHGASFPGALATWAVASIAAGNTAGRLWVTPSAAGAPALLLWDQGNNVFYLTGAGEGAAAQRGLAALIESEVAPQAQAMGRQYFKVRALTPGMAAAAPRLFAGLSLREVATVVYLLDEQPPAQPLPAGEKLEIVPIDRELLEQPGLEGRDEVLAEIRWMWPSLERFYTAGFGVAARAGGALAGWCTAEYVSPGRCGVGIATTPAFEGRGVASAMAAAFVQLCRARGVAPLWETAAEHGASRRVAEKAGFRLAATVPTLVGRFDAGPAAGASSQG